MNSNERVFYASDSGDFWLLQVVDDTVSIRHVPNRASGGESHTYDLGAFLVTERHSAQNQALRKMIATLAPGYSAPQAAAQEHFSRGTHWQV